jgi:hypothetical protein
VSFFDDSPATPVPPEPDYRTPEWLQPPDNVMPAAVALDTLIVSHHDLAAWISTALVYPTGLVFELVLLRRDRPPARALHRPWFMSLGDPDGPQFGIGFADGRKATADRPSGHHGRPNIVLSSQGGSASDRRWIGRLWLWPLPPLGRLTFAFAWAEQGVQEATVDIDAAPLAEAAARARALWPDDRPSAPEPPPAGGGWTAYGPA